MIRVRLGFALLFSAGLLLGQQAATRERTAAQAPKNLKVLAADADIADVMRSFNEALGVQCGFCHVSGDFASDANPQKQTARKMITMIRQIDSHFPSTVSVFPDGYHEVDCVTCHRGKAKVETVAPQHFQNRRDAGGFNPPKERAISLKVLPPGTEVHGKGSIMEEFRDALLVDCGYCHQGTNWVSDANPRKELARQMILMTRQINANFPGSGVYPAAPQAVSCYTCHRGQPHPASASNRNYARSAAK
ncbi:MAG TPA: c-type cytochrome [Bryobacteraceae bacterium]|nr:c-type cytochrome [Bryobacteraceae bacterium]